MTDTNQKLREAHDYKQANGSMNCMQCVAAYMLGFPVEMVPDFALHADATLAWDAFHAFFKAHGYAALMLPSTHAPESDYLASGSTSRGTKHIVVMNDGELVFDPHPSNAGLSKIDCIYVIARQALALPTAAPEMPLSMNQFGRLVELTREHLTDNTFVYKATSTTGDTCHFGVESAAKAWAKGGTVETIKLREFKLHTSALTAPPAGEREAFEAWLGITPCGAAHDFGWAAWKARAALSDGDAVDAQRWKTSELISRAALTHPDKRTEQMNIAFNAYRKAMESGQSYAACVDAAIDAAMRKGQL